MNARHFGDAILRRPAIDSESGARRCQNLPALVFNVTGAPRSLAPQPPAMTLQVQTLQCDGEFLANSLLCILNT